MKWKNIFIGNKLFVGTVTAAFMVIVASCSSDSDDSMAPVDPPTPEPGFVLTPVQSPVQLVEGSNQITVPISIVRAEGAQQNVSFSIRPADFQAIPNLSATIEPSQLTANVNQTQLRLTYALSANPIQSQNFDLLLTATDGSTSQTQEINVELSPTDAPDVYLLIGQSNMAGDSESGAKQAFTGGLDAPVARIRQLNVTTNDRSQYVLESDFIAIDNIVASPALITAEDPLHEPGGGNGKAGTQIGLGLSFAKTALENTTSTILLVPAAFGGTGFCSGTNSPISWNNIIRDNPFLGGTGLYDRAVARTNHALQITDGILRGILWHQGETDGNTDECAQVYAENLRQLADGLLTDIQEDARGSTARGNTSDVPFVLGTLSRGVDERGDFSTLTPAQQLVDNAHRTFDNSRPNTGVVINDDLVPPGFPCGTVSCIHFGADAYREMGVRYYQTLQQLW